MTAKFQHQCEVIEDLHKELALAHKKLWVYRITSLMAWGLVVVLSYSIGK